MEIHLETLEKYCEVIADCPHSTPKWTESGVVVIRNENIKNGRLDLSSPSFTDHEHYRERIRRAEPKCGDLVFTREAPMGEVCAIPPEIPCCLGQRQVLIRPHAGNSTAYLLYAFQSPYVQKQIRGHGTTGSTVSNLCIGDLKKLLIPRTAQETRIAKVLSTLDAKIDLNRRINAELEAMAKLLYDYWFVQFDFPISPAQAAAMGRPDLVGKPYRTSGGKMVYHEELKREIPEGWEVKPLSRVTEIGKETVNPGSFPEQEFLLFSIPVFDQTGSYSKEFGNEIGSNKFVVSGNDILVSKLNPWFSRVVYTDAEFDGLCSTEFVVWRTGVASTKAFLYMVATSEQFVMHCTQGAAGTSNSHKRVNPGVMMAFQVPFDPILVKDFGERVRPILELRQVNQKENKHLTQLRDWLLPMLMNGQVTVADSP